MRRCLDFRLYTTICNSAPSEFLSEVALRHREELIRRNLEIVHRNLPLLEKFFQRNSDLFECVKPDASPMCFPRFQGTQSAQQFCDDLVRDRGVMLLPGDLYDEPHHIRFGYARKNMPEALEQLAAYLASQRQVV